MTSCTISFGSMSPSYGNETDFHRALALLLAELRLNASVSQGTLATELGIDQAAVSRVESGQRRLTVEETFAWFEALGLDVPEMAGKLADLWMQYGGRPPGFWMAPDA